MSSKENRAYYLSIGKCPQCGGARPLMEGRVLCAECAAKHDAFQAENRAKWRAEGKCIRCGVELTGPYKQCDRCIQYARRFRIRNKQAAKERRDRLREKGICTRCGKTWADAGRTTCKKCRDKHNAELKRYDPDNAKKYMLREKLRESGRCIDCGKKAETGQVRCMRCARRNRESMQVYKIRKKIEKSVKLARERSAT